ncbi:MAG TPA: 4-hydroxy-3-methylbut-2-enyl diphosphate reductase [Chloroflexia bacterium]|nr:4-hydroxy-3-methylbut-2-enyl diphosphate reductase [Chloroflexia bacterium]
MEIKLAREMGMCFGVKMTLDQIAAAGQQHARIDTLGTLVHNPQLVDRLQTQGVEVKEGLDQIQAPVVAITAHGAAPDIAARAQAAGRTVIDTTCPLVTRVQQTAKKEADEGSWIIIFGDSSHPETKGILGWANSTFDGTAPPLPGSLAARKPLKSPRRAICARSVADIDAALAAAGTPNAKVMRVALLSQTTMNVAWFKKFVTEVVERFLEFGTEIHVHNTICLPTAKRQPAAEALAQEVDLVIAIGGYESANTRHLAELAAQYCPSHHIERAEELDPAWFAGVEKVGVTAGASTPDWVIDQVIAAIQALDAREPALSTKS